MLPHKITISGNRSSPVLFLNENFPSIFFAHKNHTQKSSERQLLFYGMYLMRCWCCSCLSVAQIANTFYVRVSTTLPMHALLSAGQPATCTHRGTFVSYVILHLCLFVNSLCMNSFRFVHRQLRALHHQRVTSLVFAFRVQSIFSYMAKIQSINKLHANDNNLRMQITVYDPIHIHRRTDACTHSQSETM